MLRHRAVSASSIASAASVIAASIASAASVSAAGVFDVYFSEKFVFAKKPWALGASVVLWQNWQNCQHGRQNLFMFKIQKLLGFKFK